MPVTFHVEKKICMTYTYTLNISYSLPLPTLISVSTFIESLRTPRVGVRQGCILSLCLFNLHAEYIMRNAGLEETQAGIKIAGRNINHLRYADDTTLMAKVKRN